MRPHIIVLSLVLALAMAGILLFLVATARPPKGTLETTPGTITRIEDPSQNLYADLFIPEFTLSDRNGETITHAVLDGQYTVVDFFFTSCPLICPMMTAEMMRVQDATAGSRVRLLSISIDGVNDTPAVLDRYANDHRADPDRWRFATGDPAYVAGLVKAGVRFEVGSPVIDPASGARNIDHPSRLFLIGPDRTVVGLFRYDDPDEVQALIAKIRAME